MPIEVKNITKLYGKQKALNNVSFSIAKGGVVGLLGPNGAGKSTMMKILSCFISQTEGQASVCGFDTIKNSMDVRKRLGYLPESNPLYQEMYIREFLEFSAGFYKIPNKKNRINELIEMVGLEREIKKRIGALSKGYKQRVGLAQALLHNPDVLILDEPTSGLDPNQVVGMRKIITDLGKEKTIILSTHIMQEVEAMCDRVIIINQGNLVADKSISEITSQIEDKNIYKIEFSEEIKEEKLRSILTNINSFANIENVEANIWRLYFDKGEDVRPQVFKQIVDNGFTFISLIKEERSIEGVFRALTK